MKTPLKLIVILTCAAGAAPFVSCASSSGTPRRAAAPGRDAAEASQAEGRRKARGEAGKSPLPAGPYEFSPDELGLINPRLNAFDADVSALCRRYARSKPPERARMRKAMSGEDFYTLLSFAGRARRAPPLLPRRRALLPGRLRELRDRREPVPLRAGARRDSATPREELRPRAAEA